MIAMRSCSRLSHVRRLSTFFCSSEKNDSMAALSPAEPTWPIEPSMRWRNSALGGISERERDVVHLLALGYTNQEIGKKLYVSPRTVDTHRARIMRKLELATRAELVLFALAHGVIGAW
jgi:DNA-binding NarL/FixJ family response regulator